MESIYIETNGIKLHCKKTGTGDRLLILLHGFPEFWYSWRNQIPVLSEHFTLVVPDLRGYGQSDKPKGVEAYKMENLVKDVAGIIRYFGKEKAHIVGHDWGGAIAWSIASFMPELVEKLVVLNCPMPNIFRKHLMSNPKQLMKSWYILFFQIPFIPERLLGLRLRRFFKASFQGWAYNKNAFPSKDIDRYVDAFQEPYSLTAAINYYRATVRYPKWSDGRKAQNINQPVLLIWGENDKALGKEMTYPTRQYCTGELHIKYIPECSHWVQHDKPELVNKYMLDFLKG